MADYQSTVELILNGLEKLKQAEDRIKGLDGKNVKIKFDVDASGIKKVQDSLKQSFGGVGGGVGGGVTSSKATANMTKGVRGYFNEYNKAIKEGYKSTERAIGGGERADLESVFQQQATD